MSGIDTSAATQMLQLGAQKEVEEETEQGQLESTTGGLDLGLQKELATEISDLHINDKVATTPADPGVQFRDEEAIAPVGSEPTEIRRGVKSDVGDTNIPDETLPTLGLRDGMDSDHDWLPPNDSEASQEWEDQDCSPQRRSRVKDEKPNWTIRKPPSDSGVTRSGAGAGCEDQNPMVGCRNRTYSRKTILALIDNARRTQLTVMARKSLPGSEFEGEFCKIAAKHPICSTIAPKTLLLAPEREYPEVWEFASVELIERLSVSRAMKMIHEAKDLPKAEVTRQVSCAGVLNMANGVAVASIISSIPKLFRASFPSLMLVRGMSDNGKEALHCETTVDEWSAKLESPSRSSMQFGSSAGLWWSVPEVLILGMACALLPSWKLVARSVTNDNCKMYC